MPLQEPTTLLVELVPILEEVDEAPLISPYEQFYLSSDNDRQIWLLFTVAVGCVPPRVVYIPDGALNHFILLY